MPSYVMREKLLSLRDASTIDDEQGNPVFKVHGKLLRVRETFDLMDLQGNVLVTVQDRPVRVRDTMAIMRNGQTVATVHKALIAPLRERYTINIAGSNNNMEAQGNFLHHEYTIKQGGQKLAEITKKRLRIRDTYAVDVEQGNDDVLMLAITVCIDEMRD